MFLAQATRADRTRGVLADPCAWFGASASAAYLALAAASAGAHLPARRWLRPSAGADVPAHATDAIGQRGFADAHWRGSRPTDRPVRVPELRRLALSHSLVQQHAGRHGDIEAFDRPELRQPHH
jgi:hypothetical protein